MEQNAKNLISTRMIIYFFTKHMIIVEWESGHEE